MILYAVPFEWWLFKDNRLFKECPASCNSPNNFVSMRLTSLWLDHTLSFKYRLSNFVKAYCFPQGVETQVEQSELQDLRVASILEATQALLWLLWGLPCIWHADLSSCCAAVLDSSSHSWQGGLRGFAVSLKSRVDLDTQLNQMSGCYTLFDQDQSLLAGVSEVRK